MFELKQIYVSRKSAFQFELLGQEAGFFNVIKVMFFNRAICHILNLIWWALRLSGSTLTKAIHLPAEKKGKKKRSIKISNTQKYKIKMFNLQRRALHSYSALFRFTEWKNVLNNIKFLSFAHDYSMRILDKVSQDWMLWRSPQDKINVLSYYFV